MFLPLQSSIVVDTVGYRDTVWDKDRGWIINHSVHISSEGERSKAALFVHSLGKFSDHYISCVCIAPFIHGEFFVVFGRQKGFAGIDTV